MTQQQAIIGGALVFLFIGGGVKMTIDLSKASENEKKYAPLIVALEQKYNIKSGVLHRLIKQESAFRSDIIEGKKRSSTGAMGIAQFMPKTAKEWLGSEDNALNTKIALDGAARYLRWLYVQTGGDWTKAVAAYNWGIGNVKNKGLARAPSETQKYVKNILGVAIA